MERKKLMRAFEKSACSSLAYDRLQLKLFWSSVCHNVIDKSSRGTRVTFAFLGRLRVLVL